MYRKNRRNLSKIMRTSGGQHCAAIGCRNNRMKKKCLSFFRFPKDETRCRIWAQNTRRLDLINVPCDRLNKNFVLCAEHFEANQFNNREAKNRLKWNAEPTIFVIPNPPSLKKKPSSTSPTSQPALKRKRTSIESVVTDENPEQAVDLVSSTSARNSHCFVVGCKTGYKTKVKSKNTEEKRSLFSPSAKNLALWSKAIRRADRQLSMKDRVCELHFCRHHIIREDRFTVRGETVIMPRERPRLHADAVPCIFPNLAQHLNRQVAKPRRTLVKHNIKTEAHMEVGSENNNATTGDLVPQMNVKTEAHTGVGGENNNATTGDLGPQMSFSDLTNSRLSIVAQCPPGWTVRASESVVCFGKIVLEESCLQCTACVSVSSEEEVSIFYRNRKLSVGCRLQGQEHLLQLIRKMNAMGE